MMFPLNVIDTIVEFSSFEDKVKLAQTSRDFKHAVYSLLYKSIMIVDEGSYENLTHMVISSNRLSAFANSLSLSNFQYIDRIIINTHSTDVGSHVLALFEKLSSLWEQCDHVIDFLHYDILSLRASNSLNNYLELNSVSLAEYDDLDCIVTRRGCKMMNLRTWFMFGIDQFLAAPANENLERLSFYIESNFYQESGLTLGENAPLQNLLRLSEVFLHSPLAFLKFSDMLTELGAPRLSIRRLSITSTHRMRNDASLNFTSINRQFDLNNLEELELKISCGRAHECQDLCMVKFFEDWHNHNTQSGMMVKIRKLSIIHHKSLAETSQFKRIVEQHVIGPDFSSLRELYLNLSDSVRTPQNNNIDTLKVLRNISNMYNLEKLHISSFMSEWVSGLPAVFSEITPDQVRSENYHDMLINRCSCLECNQTRSVFVELAKLDKTNNYSHRVKLSDVNPYLVESCVDFSKIENVKFLQFVGGALKRDETVMERNITRSGTMLDMDNMIQMKSEAMPFRKLLLHSCVEDLCNALKQRCASLRNVDFGGIRV